MDIATRHEAETRRIVANTTQLNKVTGSLGRETWGFRDWSFKGTNVPRAAASGLAAALALASGTSPRAADLIGQIPSQATASVAIPYDWTGAYFGGHVGYSRGRGGTRCSIRT
jgi:hypothetical protein